MAASVPYLTRREELTAADIRRLWSTSSWRDWEGLTDSLVFDRRKLASAMDLLEAERRELMWRSDLVGVGPVDAELDPFHWRANVLDRDAEKSGHGLELRIPSDYPRRGPAVWELAADGRTRVRQLRVMADDGSAGESEWSAENTLSDVLASALKAIRENTVIADGPTQPSDSRRLFHLRLQNGAQAILSHGLQVEGFLLEPTTSLMAAIPIVSFESDGVPSVEDAVEICRSLARRTPSHGAITAVSMRRHGGDGPERRFLVAQFANEASRDAAIRGIAGAEPFQLGSANRLSDFYGHIPPITVHRVVPAPCQSCWTVPTETITDYWRLVNCGHCYCTGRLEDNCLLTMIRSSQSCPIRCVAQGCKQALSMADIDAALLPAFDSAAALDAFLEPIVGRAVAKFLQANMDGYKECHRDGCNSIIQIDEVSPVAIKTCVGCRGNYCSQCGFAVHAGWDCANNYQRNVRPREEFNQAGNFFWCPSATCNYGPMERISGCNHIACRRCGLQFTSPGGS